MLLKKTKHGLDKLSASIIDVDSSYLFDIFIPKQLKAGKNEIRIRLVNDGLLKGSDVLIDVLDVQGNPFYYEFSEVANQDKTRSIIVYVDENVIGPAKLYIYAKLSVESSYMTIINLDVNSDLETDQEIKFVGQPEIFCVERKIPTQNINNQTREVVKLNSIGSVSTISPIIPNQLIDSVFSIETPEIRNVSEPNNIELPKHFDLSIITSKNFPFSSSFKNGTIEIGGINLEVPKNAIGTSSFVNQRYSASIINVVSTSSIEVYPPFSKVIEYNTNNGKQTILFDKFTNQANFTCSYNEILALSQTRYTQSYAVFDIFNLETVSGKVDSIDINFKNLSLIGNNYEPIGNFKIKSNNYLVDTSSLIFTNEVGLSEQQIGIFKNGISDFGLYWVTSSNSDIRKSVALADAVQINGYDALFYPKPTYLIKTYDKTEWSLQFDYILESDRVNIPQLDIFITGSNNIKTDNKLEPTLAPYSGSDAGKYIGSINNKSGKATFDFIVNDHCFISPSFVLSSGLLNITNITLSPKDKVGYNANQTRIYTPMNIPTGSEINFKIDYVNPTGKKLNTFSSLIPGVYFEGSNTIIGSTSLVLPNGLVSGSDQLTSSYDTRYERKGTSIISASQQVNYNLVTNIPSNLVSSSAQVKNLLPSGTVSSSQQINSGSFSGSFSGNGSQLTGVTASYALIPSGTYGEYTGTTNDTGLLIIPHQLGTTPTMAVANVVSSTTPYFCLIRTKTSTDFDIIVMESTTGIGVASESVTVDWICR